MSRRARTYAGFYAISITDWWMSSYLRIQPYVYVGFTCLMLFLFEYFESLVRSRSLNNKGVTLRFPSSISLATTLQPMRNWLYGVQIWFWRFIHLLIKRPAPKSNKIDKISSCLVINKNIFIVFVPVQLAPNKNIPPYILL